MRHEYFTFFSTSTRRLSPAAMLLLAVGLGSLTVSTKIADDQLRFFRADSLRLAKLKLRQTIYDKSLPRYQMLSVNGDESYGNRIEFISEIEHLLKAVGIIDSNYVFTDTHNLELDQAMEEQSIRVIESLLEIHASVLHDGILLQLLAGVLSVKNTLVENRGCSVSRQFGAARVSTLSIHCVFSFYTIRKLSDAQKNRILD